MSKLSHAYLEKARQSLNEAQAVANIGLSAAAGRAAYLATFHAAQALILSRTRKVAKTHAGVRSEFARIAKEQSGLDRDLASFLARAYNLKTLADYAVGADAEVSASDAAGAIDGAAHFLAAIERALSGRQ